ncbi:MAG: transglycosylase domain-containing protein, partial [Coprobacillus sp.]
MKQKKTSTPKQDMLKRIQRKKIKKIVLISLATVIAFGTIYMAVAVFDQVSGFSKEKLLSGESSTQVTADGETEYYSYGSGGVRKNVAYEDIPQVMIDAVVAAEDSRFFEHNGFDVPRIVKALMKNIVAMDITGGGSTITQQVIKKSYYPKEEQTIQRKIGEVILSIEATSQTTKQEILELYLNKIYFGYGNKAIGIYAASSYYFDKSVQNLTLPEAALLAGTLNSPNSFDPFRNLDLAQKRRDTILDLMELHGYISSEECEATKKIPVENTLKKNPLNAGGKYQAYADMVTREVIEKTGMDPEKTSMRIYTYMNPSLQEKLDDISTGKTFDYPDKYLQVGSVVQESTTGRVTGVLAARDYEPLGTSFAYAADREKNAKSMAEKDYQYNYGQRNQPGSSLKPIISYAAAFEFLNYSTAHYV